MSPSSVYHEGELLVQQRSHEVEIARRNGAVVNDTIPRGAMRFISHQPLAILGSVDSQSRLWASALIGEPGFMSAEDRRVQFDLAQMETVHGDPLWTNLKSHPEVGLLALEFSSRRRLRINGKLAPEGEGVLNLNVREAYPNCPKYIQKRAVFFDRDGLPSVEPVEPRSGSDLTTEQQRFIGQTDTMFVASAHPERGIDASHRGGHPGFVRIIDERTLRIPDYAGNSMFNTLGNFVSNPRAGLLFLDFETGATLQMSGVPRILWDLDLKDHQTGGTHRYWEFAVERWIESSLPVRARWELLEPSPFNP